MNTEHQSNPNNNRSASTHPPEQMADEGHVSHQDLIDILEQTVPTVERTQDFIETQGEALGKLLGIRGLDIKIGEGFTTDLETGAVTVDPSFFLEKGYRPQWCVYGLLHELSAHVREAITEPQLTREVLRFSNRSKAYHEFHNTLADIAGNRDIHRRLPAMVQTAREVYDQKLFPGSDYRTCNSENAPEASPDLLGKPLPRHLQFLDKMIRDEMIRGSETLVAPEVDAALDRLHDFENTGQDAIREATDPVRDSRTRFEMMTELILPEYEALLEQDQADPAFSEQSGGGEESELGEREQSSEANGQTGEGQPKGKPGQGDRQEQESDRSQQATGESGEEEGGDQSPQTPRPGDTGTGKPDFTPYYEDMDARHPEPFTEEQEKQIRQIAKRINLQTPQTRARHAAEIQTGHTETEIHRYQTELARHQAEIEQMQDFFEAIISRRLQMVRRLGRPSREGVMLDPALLAQTDVDVRSGISDPSTLVNYERQARPELTPGGYDLHLAIDVSGSMAGEKAQMAATSSMIFLEGLDLFEQHIHQTEEQERVQLGLDVRTEVNIFGDDASTLKPLSATLSEKERLDTYYRANQAASSTTQDYLALEQIITNHEADLASGEVTSERKRVVIVVTDGGSSNEDRAIAAVERLRKLGFTVIGIGITDTNAERLYEPSGRTINEPAQLPQTLISIIETQVNK